MATYKFIDCYLLFYRNHFMELKIWLYKLNLKRHGYKGSQLAALRTSMNEYKRIIKILPESKLRHVFEKNLLGELVEVVCVDDNWSFIPIGDWNKSLLKILKFFAES